MNIFLIERNVTAAKIDDCEPKVGIATDRNFSALILTEWAMWNASKSINDSVQLADTSSYDKAVGQYATVSSMVEITKRICSQTVSQETRIAIARSLRIDYSNCSSPSKQSPRWPEEVEGSEAHRKKAVSRFKVLGVCIPSSSISNVKSGNHLRNDVSETPNHVDNVNTSPRGKKRHESDAGKKDFQNLKCDLGSHGKEKDVRVLEGDSAWNHGNEGAYIPSIALTLLSGGLHRSMTANSPKPVPFENDIFVGNLLLLVNTKPICDQYFKRFEGVSFGSLLSLDFSN